jgi:hypothetical protein
VQVEEIVPVDPSQLAALVENDTKYKITKKAKLSIAAREERTLAFIINSLP